MRKESDLLGLRVMPDLFFPTDESVAPVYPKNQFF
jgi:hypothetical protein